jgi:hypothetical protein
MKKLLFLLVVLVLLSCALVAAAQNLTYTNEKAGWSFLYPKGWAVKADAGEVSVFSPETRVHPQNTLDVERGLKVEFVKLPEGQKEFKKVLKDSKCTAYKIILRNGKEHIQIYSSYDQGMLYLMAFNPETNILITGYVPDQDNWKDFEEKWIIIVVSFDSLKNDKDGSP